MPKENQRITLTRRLMKEALLRLLETRELDKISVTELCAAADINRATFYRHYQIPRDVLMEIQQDLYRNLLKSVKMPKTSEEIHPAIQKLCAFLEQNAELMRLILRNNTDADFAAFVGTLYDDILSQVKEAGILPRLSDEDLRLLVLYCAGGSYFILRQWLLGNVRKSAREMADYVYTLLNRTDWAALSTQLGLTLKA